MKSRLHILLLLLAVLPVLAANDDDELPSPFNLTARLVAQPDRQTIVHMEFAFPRNCVIYADHLRFATESAEIEPLNLPAPITDIDKASGEERAMYDRPFSVDLAFAPGFTGELLVRLQGCSNNICFFPEKHLFSVTSSNVVIAERPAPHAPVQVAQNPNAGSVNWLAEAQQFHPVARETGYIRPGDFVDFLRRAATVRSEPATDVLVQFKQIGLWATLAVIVGVGVVLHFMPGWRRVSAVAALTKTDHGRARRRWLPGLLSALGLAAIYSALGLAVVLSGAKFSALNSSAWFNAAIAGIFLALALALFGGLNLDFTKIGGSRDGLAAHRRRSLVTFVAGAFAALLAGACVAPVVVSVLLLAAEMHSQGRTFGLVLPFLLGLGLALPWPFTGAGAVLPAIPSGWLKWARRGMGVLIFGIGVYYACTAAGLTHPEHPATDLTTAPGYGLEVAGANQSLTRALKQARAQGQHVLVEFRASWCRNCLAMESTVFNHADVRDEMEHFVVVRYQAERPSESPAKEVLDYFGVLGLPTYVVLTPNR